MNDNIQKEVITLPPFKRFCMTIGELPSSYVETMTYYEMVLWFTKYLGDTIIPTVNNNAEAVTELQNLFVELQSYVNNYFDNLDVQEEINNKLDEMVEDGSLEEIIEAYAREKVEYIFPKFWSNQPSQDCNIIKGYGKNIVIDCGSSTNWNNILLMLINNTVTHIDYFILSHYDSDHVGNLQNLVNNNYIDSDTEVFLPIVPDRFSSVQATETTIKNMLTTNNISYRTPSEGEVLSINEYLTIKFGNLNKNYMEENYNNYNYTSMVCLVTHKQNTSFYAGDIGSPAFKYLDDIGFITKTIDLYKQPHHGIDLNYTYPQFIKYISPRYTVQSGGINDFGRDIYQCPETSLLISLGSLYYPTYMIEDYVKFESDGSSMVNKVGKNCSFSDRNVPINLYVDINATNTDLQLGTQEKPFKQLGQALGFAYNWPVGDINIHLADGSYGLETTEIDNIAPRNNVNIIINGNENDNTAVIIDNLNIYNTNITFKNLTINSSKNDYSVKIYNCYCVLNNCKISCTYSTATNGILTASGSLYIYNCSFNNLNSAIIGYNGSLVTLDGTNTFTNVTTRIQNNNSINIKPINIDFEFDAENHKYTLSDKYTKYDVIEIFGSYNTYKGSIKIRNVSSENVPLIINHMATNGNTLSTILVDLRFRDTNIIWMNNPRQIDINSTPGITYSNLSDNSITIDKIVGYID